MTTKTSQPTIRVHRYACQVGSPEYTEIKRQAKAAGHKLMRVYPRQPGYIRKVRSGTYAIDTKHLFGDQYNTTEDSGNLRLHDWYEEINPHDDDSRVGYWCELSPELEAAKDARHVCGYCGAQYDNPTHHMCRRCLGSPYLKADELHMLLLVPVRESSGADRSALVGRLPDGMRAAFEREQEHAAEARKAAEIQRATEHAHSLVENARDAVTQAEYERDFHLACIKAGLVRFLSNLIYYTHKGRFCFGWRESLTDEDRDTLQATISEMQGGDFAPFVDYK